MIVQRLKWPQEKVIWNFFLRKQKRKIKTFIDFQTFSKYARFFFLVCSTTYIKNNRKSFDKLKYCRVIEGSLVISLFELTRDGELDDLEFPLLTEITGYLLVFRVFHLKSLGNLFPNLRIIRGNSLLRDYAFVVFQTLHLEVSFMMRHHSRVLTLFTDIQTIFYFHSSHRKLVSSHWLKLNVAPYG